MSKLNNYQYWCVIIAYHTSGDGFAISKCCSDSPFTVSEWTGVGTDKLNIKLKPTGNSAIMYYGGKSTVAKKELYNDGSLQIGDKANPVFGGENWYQMGTGGINGDSDTTNNCVLGYLTNTE